MQPTHINVATISIMKAENWKKKLTSGHIITSVVAAIGVFPVAHLPITDLLIGVQVIGEVAPSLGTGWNVNVTKVFLILLDHRKDAISKLINSIGVKGNGVEL
jgi:hypothetical protein|tara:strand:- start:510 stop:818 length:309 start_codon:yes stop_codon:yes gene_type:complete